MKKILFGSLAIVFAVALVSFTNADKSSKFACTWFVFDDNSVTNPGATGNANGTATLAEAQDYRNYKALTVGQNVNTLCPSTVRLCAICVEATQQIGGVTKPVINEADDVYFAISDYFANQEPTEVHPSGLILEKP